MSCHNCFDYKKEAYDFIYEGDLRDFILHRSDSETDIDFVIIDGQDYFDLNYIANNFSIKEIVKIFNNLKKLNNE